MALFGCWPPRRSALESGSYAFRWIQCPPRQRLAIKSVPYPLHADLMFEEYVLQEYEDTATSWRKTGGSGKLFFSVDRANARFVLINRLQLRVFFRQLWFSRIFFRTGRLVDEFEN